MMESSDVSVPIDNWQRPCEGTRELSKNSPTSVIVMTVEDDGTLWVIPESERQVLDKIAICLKGLLPPDDPLPVAFNQTCAAFFSDGSWYRARVISTEPEISVHFIDFGNTCVVAADEITNLPPSVTIYPPLAMKIQLPADCQLQLVESTLLCVLPVLKKGDVTLVDLTEPESGLTEMSVTDNDASKSSVCEVVPLPESITSHSTQILECVQDSGQNLSSEIELSKSCSTLDRRSSTSKNLTSEGLSVNVTSEVSENVESIPELKKDQSDSCMTEHSPELLSSGTVDASQGCMIEDGESTVCIQKASSSESSSDSSEMPKNAPQNSTVLDLEVVIDNSVPHYTSERSDVKSSSNALELSSTSDSNGLDVQQSSASCLLDSVKKESQLSSLAGDLPYEGNIHQEIRNSQETKSSDSSQWTHVNRTASEKDLHESPSGSRSGASQDGDPFISALSRYPHLGGGYGTHHTDDNDAESYQNLHEPAKLARGNSQTQSINKNKSGSHIDDDADWQSFTTSSSHFSGVKTTSKQKGRNQPSAGRSLRSQHHSNANNNQISHASGTASDISSIDVKAKLDFELAILREQNRLQMLQMQKQMDESVSGLKQQLLNLQEEMVRGLAVLRNEINSRLMVINDNVVQKIAQFYTDIATLKNTQVLSKQHNGREMAMNASVKPVRAQGSQYHVDQTEFQQRQQGQCGNAEPQFSLQNYPVDQHPPNQYNRQQTAQQFSQSNQNHLIDSERKYSESSEAPICRLLRMRKDKMAEQEQIQRQHQNHQQQQHQHPNHKQQHQYLNHKQLQQQPPPQQQHSNHKLQQRQQQQLQQQEFQYHYHQPKHVNGRGTSNQPGQTPPCQNNSNYPKMDHFYANEQGRTEENDWGEDVNQTCSSGVVCVANIDSEKITPDILFNLFGLYGNVLRVKLSFPEKEQGFVEMADAAQAEAGIQYLNGVKLMGRPLQVTPCDLKRITMNRSDLMTNTCKDYSKPALSKFHRFKQGTWNSSKLFPPSERLLITNVLRTVSDENIKEAFAKKGFSLLSVYSNPAVHEEKKYAFVALSSVEEAVAALVEMHLTELSDWMQMKISFAKPPKTRDNAVG